MNAERRPDGGAVAVSPPSSTGSNGSTGDCDSNDFPRANGWTFQESRESYDRDPRVPADASVLTELPGEEEVGHPGEEEVGGSWDRVDLGPALRGEIDAVVPTVLRRDDFHALLYAGCVNGVHGDSGIGKGMVAAVAVSQVLNAGHHAVWVDFEDSPAVIVERLNVLLGVSATAIYERLHYFRPAEPFDDDAVELIRDVLRGRDVALVVVDSLGEAFGLEGIDEDRDAQVAPWLRRVARRLADAGPAVLLIDHSTKAKDNPLFPSGSKRKRAAITGASYLLEAPAPLTRENGGRLRLICAKDRHGHYRRGEVVASFDFHVYPDGGVSVKVWPPAPAESASPDERLRVIARAAVRLAKEADHPLSQRELVEGMNVKARAELKRAAIDHAVGVGALSVERGTRNAVLHVYVRDLDTTSVSDRVPSSSDAHGLARVPTASSASRPIGTQRWDADAVADSSDAEPATPDAVR